MMMIKHHLSETLLFGYAAGTLPEAFSLIAATHVTLCDDCRARLAALEALGGAVVEDMNASPMTDGALDRAMTRLLPPDRRTMAQRRHAVLPAPLLDYVGGDLDAVRWKPVGMGVRQAILPTSKGAMARLLHIPAGRAVPDHGHRGTELTLVLSGAFHDTIDRFGPGDLEIATSDLVHTPIAEPGADCICLAATDAPLRFISLIPRLLQPIFRI